MIPRYTPEDIGALWTDARKLRAWLDVELAVTETLAETDARVPAADVAELRRVAAAVDFEALARRAQEIEKTTHHDVIAFLSAFEELAGAPSRHVHFGLTSSDVVDTGLALVLGDKAEDAFRQSMLMSQGTVSIFFANGLVTSITVLALMMLFWAPIKAVIAKVRGR